MTEDDLRTQLEPIYSALGAIMESITTLVVSVTALREQMMSAPAEPSKPPSIPSPVSVVDLAHLKNPRTGQFVGVYAAGKRWQARLGREIIGSFAAAGSAPRTLVVMVVDGRERANPRG